MVITEGFYVEVRTDSGVYKTLSETSKPHDAENPEFCRVQSARGRLRGGRMRDRTRIFKRQCALFLVPYLCF